MLLKARRWLERPSPRTRRPRPNRSGAAASARHDRRDHRRSADGGPAAAARHQGRQRRPGRPDGRGARGARAAARLPARRPGAEAAGAGPPPSARLRRRHGPTPSATGRRASQSKGRPEAARRANDSWQPASGLVRVSHSSSGAASAAWRGCLPRFGQPWTCGPNAVKKAATRRVQEAVELRLKSLASTVISSA